MSQCQTCQRIKASAQKQPGLLLHIRPPNKPWEQITMDSITHLPKTPRGCDAIFTIVDTFSKQLIIELTKTTATAVDSARIFFDRVFRYHARPIKIISSWTKIYKQLLETLIPSNGYTTGSLHGKSSPNRRSIRKSKSHKSTNDTSIHTRMWIQLG